MLKATNFIYATEQICVYRYNIFVFKSDGSNKDNFYQGVCGLRHFLFSSDIAFIIIHKTRQNQPKLVSSNYDINDQCDTIAKNG